MSYNHTRTGPSSTGGAVIFPPKSPEIWKKYPRKTGISLFLSGEGGRLASQPPGSYTYGYNGPSFEIVSFFQENVWFSLGCAAMVTVKLGVASKAFHRCVSMNPDVSLMLTSEHLFFVTLILITLIINLLS